MFRDEKASKEERIRYLQTLVSEKKVTQQPEAHRALKKRFGETLPIGEVAKILAGKDPRTAGRPGRKKGSGGRPGRRRGRRPRPALDARYVILGPGNDLCAADSRDEVDAHIRRLVENGYESRHIRIYQQVGYEVKHSIEVEIGNLIGNLE